MANRHLSRTIAMQTLFVWDFNNQKVDIDSVIQNNFSNFAPGSDNQDFVKELVNGVLKILLVLMIILRSMRQNGQWIKLLLWIEMF